MELMFNNYNSIKSIIRMREGMRMDCNDTLLNV